MPAREKLKKSMVLQIISYLMAEKISLKGSSAQVNRRGQLQRELGVGILK